MGKIKEYELVNILVVLERSPYAFDSAAPSTPINEVPPAEVSSKTEYSINKGTGEPVVLVKSPVFPP
jgi:hypothetical protein